MALQHPDRVDAAGLFVFAPALVPICHLRMVSLIRFRAWRMRLDLHFKIFACILILTPVVAPCNADTMAYPDHVNPTDNNAAMREPHPLCRSLREYPSLYQRLPHPRDKCMDRRERVGTDFQ